MTNGESSCLETEKAGMERNLFCKHTQDMGDLSTCCLHKSTCWHCTVGLQRASLKKKKSVRSMECKKLGLTCGLGRH